MSVAVQPQPNRSEKSKRRIIDNAAKIFFERGFKNVSVEELCRIIGVSKGTFYKHFENRDALVETVLDECLAEAVPAMVENFESDKDVVEIIETHYHLLADLFISRLSAQMMADMESHMPATWERIETQRRAETRQFLRLFRRGQKEGSIRKDIDPEAASAMFEQVMRSLFNPSFLVSRNLTLTQMSSVLITVHLHGIISNEKK